MVRTWIGFWGVQCWALPKQDETETKSSFLPWRLEVLGVHHLLSAVSPPAHHLFSSSPGLSQSLCRSRWSRKRLEACCVDGGLARRPNNADRDALCHTGLLISCVVFLHFRPQDEPMEEEEPMNQ